MRRGPSVKNGFSLTRSGNSDVASVSASASWRSSSPGAPVRGPGIDRIEDHVATFGRVELRCVLERRVVDDRRVAPVLELTQDLSDQRRLARPRVAAKITL